MENYEFIEHTADIRIKVYGESLNSLFANAAFALFDIICGNCQIKPEKTEDIFLEADNPEELLVEWLRELLYRFNVKETVYSDFTVTSFSEGKLEAQIKGRKFDTKKFKIKTEIKAITYHKLNIKKEKGIWTAKIIFDV